MELFTDEVGFIGIGNMAQLVEKGIISFDSLLIVLLCRVFNNLNLPYTVMLKPNQFWVNASDDDTL